MGNDLMRLPSGRGSIFGRAFSRTFTCCCVGAMRGGSSGLPLEGIVGETPDTHLDAPKLCGLLGKFRGGTTRCLPQADALMLCVPDGGKGRVIIVKHALIKAHAAIHDPDARFCRRRHLLRTASLCCPVSSRQEPISVTAPPSSAALRRSRF